MRDTIQSFTNNFEGERDGTTTTHAKHSFEGPRRMFDIFRGHGATPLPLKRKVIQRRVR